MSHLLAALEQDLREENDTSQSQQVTAACADLGVSGPIVGVAVVCTLSPRGPSLQAAPTQRDEDSPEALSSVGVSRIAPFSSNFVAQNRFVAIAEEEEQVEVHAMSEGSDTGERGWCSPPIAVDMG